MTFDLDIWRAGTPMLTLSRSSSKVKTIGQYSGSQEEFTRENMQVTSENKQYSWLKRRPDFEAVSK